MTCDPIGGLGRVLRVLAAASYIAIAAPALAQAPAPAEGAAKSIDLDAVVATVDGQPLTERDVQLALEELAPGGGPIDEQKRQQLIGFLINVKLVAQAAEKAKVGDNPQFAARLAFLREQALMKTYLEKIGNEAVTDEAVQKVYAETVKEMKPEQEVRARHILVETEEEAKAIAERLAKGEDFAAIAKEASKDPGSGAEGGDLGFFTKEQMVPEFAEAAFKLEPGKVSEPVKSQFGWHVIKVEEKRERPVPPLEEVRAQIEDYVRKRAQEEAVKKLLDEAKIERAATEKKPEQPAAPAKQ
jgi:peptidyl-prolyl cis-trans isomerase C